VARRGRGRSCHTLFNRDLSRRVLVCGTVSAGIRAPDIVADASAGRWLRGRGLRPLVARTFTDRFVVRRGWSLERFEEWLVETVHHGLFE
jgi:hypothetical protein